jgi:hypothetical protein
MLRRIVRSSDRGQLIPIVALALTMLMGAAALAVDVGYWRYQQRLEQSAADSAAIAGAAEISFPAAADVTAQAQSDATANGFTQGVAGATVTVNRPPASGPNAGNNNAVEVIVTKLQPKFFAGVFGGSQTVQARAVAVLSAANAGCIYVLTGGISGDLTLHGGGRGGITTTPLCGMVVNGDLSVTGQANVDASYVSYGGSGPTGGSYPHGQPVHSVAGTDPCLRLPGCAYLSTLRTTNPAQFSAPCQDTSALGGTLPASPLPPGHYCYGPYPSQAVTLQPGLFIMDQGMFGGQTAGTGVTIYNNCTPSGGRNGNSCNTTLNGGNANDTIVAPLTGPTAGMAYYQPPTLLNTITVNGAAGTVQAMGGIYAPSANFTFNGQLPTLSLLVAGSITMNGGGLNVGSAGGFPQPGNAVLAE